MTSTDLAPVLSHLYNPFHHNSSNNCHNVLNDSGFDILLGPNLY